MKKFCSMENVDRAELPEGLREAVRGTLTTLMDAYAEIGERYNPEVDGHTVLIEEGDGDESIRTAQPTNRFTTKARRYEGSRRRIL